jgi:hypothetical protein
MSSDCAKPATTLQTTSQQTPSTNMIFPPYMSASLPKGRRKQDITNENADAGHVDDDAGMASAVRTDGTRRLKPETKYSFCHVVIEVSVSQ